RSRFGGVKRGEGTGNQHKLKKEESAPLWAARSRGFKSYGLNEQPPKMVQSFLLAALQASWLPAGESGKFGKFRLWQLSELKVQAPPTAATCPPLFRQSSALTQAA